MRVRVRTRVLCDCATENSVDKRMCAGAHVPCAYIGFCVRMNFVRERSCVSE